MRRPDWQTSGTQPDYRFSLANERTFLAWIRTALAVLAGGILLDQFATSLQPRLVLVGVALALAVLSATLAGGAYLRWKGNEIAMRHSAPLPAPRAIALLSVAITAVATVLAFLLLLSLL